MAKQRKLALLSVYNKDGIATFAKQLVMLGFDVLASGGTATQLIRAGLTVRDTADFIADGQTTLFLKVAKTLGIQLNGTTQAQVHSGFRQYAGAFVGHRVVTLTQEIHAGLMAIDNDDHAAQLDERGISRIELLCCDLYPLKQEILRPGSTLESVIEKTDVGGPTLLRSAAKGRRIVVSDVHDRQLVIDWLNSGQKDPDQMIAYLVSKAEAVVEQYARMSSVYHRRYALGYQDRLNGFRAAKSAALQSETPES